MKTTEFYNTAESGQQMGEALVSEDSGTPRDFFRCLHRKGWDLKAGGMCSGWWVCRKKEGRAAEKGTLILQKTGVENQLDHWQMWLRTDCGHMWRVGSSPCFCLWELSTGNNPWCGGPQVGTNIIWADTIHELNISKKFWKKYTMEVGKLAPMHIWAERLE